MRGLDKKLVRYDWEGKIAVSNVISSRCIVWLGVRLTNCNRQKSWPSKTKSRHADLKPSFPSATILPSLLPRIALKKDNKLILYSVFQKFGDFFKKIYAGQAYYTRLSTFKKLMR